ncbi:hypothetical protein D3C83_277850 [compost metagenome]
MGTRLQPLDETTSAVSTGETSKLRRMRSASPLTFSRNIACRWPFAPTTGLWNVSDNSTIGLNPGNEP